MPALDEILRERLEWLDEQQLRRRPRQSWRQTASEIIRDGKRFISFSCNDYLGLSHHPDVMQAAVDATGTYGAGAGASRLITGEHPLYAELEQALAEWQGVEAACVFGSGYLANLGTITALMEKDDLILADRLAHACMIDGARLSGSAFKRFAHNDIAHLESLLKAHRAAHRHCLILTESVFSMDGDRAPLAELAALAKAYDAWLLVDGAHEIDKHHPERSEGSRASDGDPSPLAQNDRNIVVGTLSKTLGSYGGYVCGSKMLVEYLKSTARPLIFTTALPPGVIAGALAALAVLRVHPEWAAAPLEKAQLFTERAGLPAAQSAIVPVVLGEAEAALSASRLLEAEGFLVSAIRPPTVPLGTSRLRLTFCTQHQDADIERVAVMVRKIRGQ